MVWSIGDGRSVSFVKDVWIYGLGSLHEHLLPNVTASDQLRVVDFIDRLGGWNWNALNRLFGKDVLEYIAGIHPPKDELGMDVCLWKGSKSGRFTVKTTYTSLMVSSSSQLDPKWKCLWDLPIAPRIKHFIGLFRHGKLLTSVERTRRRLTDDAGCGRCGATLETALYALWDCKIAMAVWARILSRQSIARFFQLEVIVWIDSNVAGEFEMVIDGVEGRIIFVVVC